MSDQEQNKLKVKLRGLSTRSKKYTHELPILQKLLCL